MIIEEIMNIKEIDRISISLEGLETLERAMEVCTIYKTSVLFDLIKNIDL